MRKRLGRILIRFVITIAMVLAFGGLFSLYTDTLSQAKQDEVLIKAIPFVAVFVSIILGFVCVIVMVAVAFEARVPLRSYRPVEWLIIAGILFGVVGLFQGWKLFIYEHGFLLLLGSVLLFMIWSHLRPMSLRQSQQMPPLTRQAHVIAVAVALVTWGIFAYITIGNANPQEPYGLGKTLWDFKSDEEKAQIRDDAESEFSNVKIPVLALASLLPAGIVYFGVRELVDARQNPARHRVMAQSLAAHGASIPHQ